MSTSSSLALNKYTNLLIARFGPKGRLGLGDKQTQMKFMPLVLDELHAFTDLNCDDQKQKTRFPQLLTKAAALGQDHTVIVTQKGEIWTCKANEHGQLGYPVDSMDKFGHDGKYLKTNANIYREKCLA
jgi:alpha-tubulin suppressor-like RCC1 family protein